VPAKTVTAVRFTAEPETLDSTTIVRLPASASERLPSRGQVAVRGTVNGHEFDTVVEPDGVRGHWLRVDPDLQRATALAVGEAAEFVVEPRADWPEPDVPDDLAAALASAPARIRAIWDDITPMARWEWVRWVNATANPTTRQRRVEVSISKMDHGKRRPCCFDLSACTDPALSRSGKLRATN
jgi:hypothetical protein